MAPGKKSTRHWLHQRITALILFPLLVWFVTSLVMMTGADYDAVLLWMTHPMMALFIFIMIVAGFYHMHLGLNEVIEDYISTPSAKKRLRGLNAGLTGLLGGIAVVSLLRLFI